MSTAFEEIMAVRGRGMPEPGEVTIVGTDPVLATRFKIAETCASAVAAVGVAVSDIWELKTGRRQKVTVDARLAAAGLRSSAYIQRPGPDGVFRNVVNEDHEAMRRITQPWPTRDGRWFLPHFGLPNLKAKVLNVLRCEPNPPAVAKAVSGWNALDLEAAIDEARACGAMVRTNTEWLAHAHGQVLLKKPVVEIIKLADSDPKPLPDGPRPLSGIRVLDLTRILAGPMSARTLAEHGAEVLMVTAEHLPQIPEHVIDTNHGKRSTFLDLTRADDAARLKASSRTPTCSRRAIGQARWRSSASGRRSLRRCGRASSTCPSAASAPMARSAIAPAGSRWRRPSPASCTKATRPPCAAAGRRLRLHHRLSRRLWHALGARAPRARRRQLSCARLALPIGHDDLSPGQAR